MVVWMMARRAALQSELSRCEAELRMLGAGRRGTVTKPPPATPDILERLALFGAAMRDVSALSEDKHATRALDIWGGIIDFFIVEIDWVKQLPEHIDASELNVVERQNSTRLALAVTHVHHSMDIIRIAYSGEISDGVTRIFANACEGLMSGGKLVVSATKGYSQNTENCLHYVEKVFQKMGRQIRIPHCSHGELYNFLGESAVKKMSESFRILDPDHGDLPSEARA